MSAADLEVSTYLGQPVELYTFTYGVQVFNYTSADQPYTFQGTTYQPVALLRADVTVNQEEGTGSLDITIQRNDPLANLFIGFMPTVQVSILRTHRNAPDSFAIYRGTTSNAKWSEATLVLTCLPTTEAMRRTIPAVVYQVQCNRVLYSQTKKYGRGASQAMEQTGCNAVRAQFEVTASVDTVDTNGTHLSCGAAAAHPDYYFNNGFAVRGNGEIRWIANHQGAAVVLMQAFSSLQAGETITLVPGCDHTTGANGCAKFSNLINYNGFFAWPQKNPFVAAINR